MNALLNSALFRLVLAGGFLALVALVSGVRI
jgi:hypothetical protein